MIDITTIQTFPVAKKLLELQNDRTTLMKNDKIQKVIIAMTALGIVAYLLYKKKKENDAGRNEGSIQGTQTNN